MEDQLGFNIKNNNRKIARATALTDIAGTDLEAFLTKVEELCREVKTASLSHATVNPGDKSHI